jgi:hypothetical protein
MNKRELFLEAIRHDGTYSLAYYNLATCLAAGESITLPDGRTRHYLALLYLTAEQCTPIPFALTRSNLTERIGIVLLV